MIAGAGIPLWLAIPLHLAAFTMAALVCHGRLAADPARAGPFDGVLLLAGVRRHARRHVQYAGGAAPVQPSHRVPARARARAGRSPRPSAEAASSWSLNDLARPDRRGRAQRGLHRLAAPGPRQHAIVRRGPGAAGLRRVHAVQAPPMRFAASVATMLVAGSLAANAQGQALYVSRTFFGVYRVTTDQDRRYHSLFHGTTLHGMQAVDPAHQGEPLTYFHREGPIGQAFAGLPAVAARRRHRGRGAWRRHARQLPDARTAVDVLRDRSRGRADRPHARRTSPTCDRAATAAVSCWATRGCRWPGRR